MKEFDFLKTLYNRQPELLKNRLRMPITDQYGSCMSLYNPDILDIASLDYAKELVNNHPQPPISAVDLGASPFCPQAIRLASLGLYVDAYDLEPPARELKQINLGLSGKVNYHQVDLANINQVETSDNYHLFYANRCLLFLRYGTAKSILEKYISKLAPGSRGFLSLGNIQAQAVKNYPDNHESIENRFAIANSHELRAAGINVPVCLYSLDDAEGLFENLPVKILTLECTGNTINAIKVIFEKYHNAHGAH